MLRMAICWPGYEPSFGLQATSKSLSAIRQLIGVASNFAYYKFDQTGELCLLIKLHYNSIITPPCN